MTAPQILRHVWNCSRGPARDSITVISRSTSVAPIHSQAPPQTLPSPGPAPAPSHRNLRHLWNVKNHKHLKNLRNLWNHKNLKKLMNVRDNRNLKNLDDLKDLKKYEAEL